MATWTLTASLPVTGGANSDLADSIPLSGAMPADFNPDAITAIRLARTLAVSGLADDSITDNQDIALVNGSDATVVFAQGSPATRSADGSWAYAPAQLNGQPANRPSSTGNYLAPAGGAWAAYNSNMKADGGVISITAVTVEIDYVPGAPPVASFTADKTTVYTDQPVQLTDTSSGGPTSWAWDFDGGAAASNQQNPAVSFASPGTFDVVLSAGNTYGSDLSDPTTITVLAREAEVWNGSAWVGGESWNGSAWVTPEVWDGVRWVPVKAP